MAAMRSRAPSTLGFALAAALVLAFGSSCANNFLIPAGARERADVPPSSALRGRKALDAAADAAVPLVAESLGSRAMAGLAAFVVAVGVLAGASPARAFFGTGNSGEIIGEIEASGLVFKDLINVERITDPKVTGVTLYQTDFSKSSFDKLKSGNLLQADPSASGLACGVNGKVLAKPDISKDKRGEEIFSESKAFPIGKTLKVKRVFDEKSSNLIYVVYTERLNKDDDPNGSRFKSQACAVHLDGFQ
eukprot:gb/GFBE01065236.1/.p1 GENE.gb/GFBE01065236.1/~~gb/GFBE01065236.1/.p1  ORF type:complete len:248 (+),score=71.38 gb/GFBE01065236.1/:1-744(+)